MNTSPLEELRLPYLVAAGLALKFVGRLDAGGLLWITAEGLEPESIALGTGAWAVGALFHERAQRAEELGQPELAFVSKRGIERWIDEHTPLAAEHHERVYKLVNELRTAIRSSRAARRAGLVGGLDLGDRVVETHRKFGYRLSLPPKQLTLIALNDDLG